MEGFKKSEGRSTRGASSLQYWLRPPPQNWMRPYDSCSSAPTALMKKLSTANLLSIHVLILRIFVFGGATRIVGAGSRQSQIGLCKGVLLANPLPGASGMGKLTTITRLSLLDGKLGNSEKVLLGPPITFSFSHSQHGSKCERTHLMPNIILDPTQCLHIILVLSDELVWSLGDNNTD